jgi:hypothetical protein
MSEDSETAQPQGVDVKEAIRRAKMQVADLLEGEPYSQLGLEEVKYDDRDDRWLITLGLNRPWNVESSLVEELRQQRSACLHQLPPGRFEHTRRSK